MRAKCDIITAITQLNPTAPPTFLAEFAAQDLERYHDRLTACDRHVGRDDQYYLPFDVVGPYTPWSDPYQAATRPATDRAAS